MNQRGEIRVRNISTQTSNDTISPGVLVSAVWRIFRPTAKRMPKVIGPSPRSKAIRQGESRSRFQRRQATTISKVEGRRMASSAP